MSAVAAAVVGSAVIGGVVASSSASKAAKAQTQAADAAAAEQRAARQELQTLLAPYTAAGIPALQAQMSALGLNGEEAQQVYVTQQEQSPIFQALARQGEEALLQKASATGGLRGGNIQGALAQFRPAMLNEFLQQQYERLGGIAKVGQASAAGVGTAGMNAATNIGGYLTDAGQAIAGGAIAQGNAWNNALGTATGFLTSPAGKTALGKIF